MRYILALLALVAGLLGCVPAPSVPATASTSLSPPGFSLLTHGWDWPKQGAPSPELDQLAGSLTSPKAIADWLMREVEWRDDYDTATFLPPAAVVEARRTVCTGFARFWVYMLARQGIKADFVAFWSQSSAHAVAVFRDASGRYRMGSNQNFYEATDLDPGNQGREAALIAAATEFYGAKGWSRVQVYSEHGVILQQVDNALAEAAPLAPAAPGRNLFSVRR